MMTSKKKQKKNLNVLKTLIFILGKKTGEKTSEFAAELRKIEEEKDKIMENSYVMFQVKVILNFQRSLLRFAI